jgi:hypothetical protein
VPLSNAESPQCGPINAVTIETLQLSSECENDEVSRFLRKLRGKCVSS